MHPEYAEWRLTRKIYDLREQAELTQASLARMIGVLSPTTLPPSLQINPN
jgi:DNA-binding XRE family transcriptional regulator